MSETSSARNPVVSKHQIQPEYGDEQADAREGMIAEPVSRDQILRWERGQGNIHFPCSADHVQDCGNLTRFDPYSCYMCGHTMPTTSSFVG